MEFYGSISESSQKDGQREWLLEREEEQVDTSSYVRDMIGAIRCDCEFIKRFMDRTNRAIETSWSTVYGRMSKLGALKEAREFLEEAT